MLPDIRALVVLVALLIFVAEALKEYADGSQKRVRRVLAKGIAKWVEVLLLGSVVAVLFDAYVKTGG